MTCHHSPMPALTHLDLVHTSPLVAHGIARRLAARSQVRVSLVAFSWAEFLRSWDFSTGRVLVDAFLDDHVPLPMKVRALRRIGSDPIVLGDPFSEAIVQRARAEGAVSWVDPADGMDGLIEAATRPQWTRPERPDALPGIRLSDRELQILSLYASRRSLSVGSLSRTLGIQPETVRAHLRRGRKRFSDRGIPVSNRGSLAAALVRDGYLIPEPAWIDQGRW